MIQEGCGAPKDLGGAENKSIHDCIVNCANLQPHHAAAESPFSQNIVLASYSQYTHDYKPVRTTTGHVSVFV